MPQTQVIFFQETGRDVPVRDWLNHLRQTDAAAFQKCVAAICRLAELGPELRRPLADILRDGIHELRIRCGRVNYRILYFFHGRHVAILAHMITKEDVVPPDEIDRAIRRRNAYIANPAKHTYLRKE